MKFSFTHSIGILVSCLLSHIALGQTVFEVSGAQQASERTVVISLSDEGRYMVDQVQADFIIESLDRIEAEGAARVILKIDTYGGVVFSARDINERLLDLKIPTIAFVETKAISAGVFIAWACDRIVMGKNTTMGDAQMIIQTMEGIEPAPEKAVTVYRSDWKKASFAKGRSFALAQAFFDVDIEVLQIGDPQKPEFMLREDYDQIPESERQAIVKVVSKKGQLLTLFDKEAEALGIADLTEDFDTLLSQLGVTEFEEVEMVFNQQILRYIGANPWIYLLLVLIGLNGLYVELKAPGFGIPGLTALVCFTLVFGSRYFLGTADVFEMVLFGAGLLLCLAEIFVIPGFGVAGISGLLLMFGSLVLASFPDFGELPGSDLQWEWLGRLATVTLVGFLSSIATVFLVFPAVIGNRLAQRHMLPNEMTSESGYVMDTVPDKDHLRGELGIARGSLRPAGKVLLDNGRYLDVVSDGGYIDQGVRVRVFKVDGNRVLVRPYQESADPEESKV